MKLYLVFFLTFVCYVATAQQQPDTAILFKPDRVFDGQAMHAGWWVLVKGNHIESAGEPSAIAVPKPVKVIDLKGMTLLPGLIEGHSHLFLHPYNEVSWNDQVLTESRAVIHACATLTAGFTTTRDLGTG